MSNEAWRNARAMYEKDTCARELGIELIEMDQWFCADDNGSHAKNAQRPSDLPRWAAVFAGGYRLCLRLQQPGLAAVASAASIDFLRPAFTGDLLTATAQVKQQGKLTGVYDIEIVNQQQKTVALFRGKSHRIGGTITGEV